MPIYVFYCPRCDVEFEELCEYEAKPKVRCKACKKKPNSVLTSPREVIFAQPKGTRKEGDWDYVFKHNGEQAKAQRRAAEAAAKGDKPYKEYDDSAFEGKIS